MNDTLKDLIEKYRSMKLAYRIILVIILALLWPALHFSENSTKKNEVLESAKSANSQKSVVYKQSIKKSEELPKLEKDISFIEGELNEAFKKLPNQVNIADVLSSITKAARLSRVELEDFQPQKEKKPEEGLKYAEKGINLKIKGLYRDIGSFLDQVVHFERLMFVKKIDFKLMGNQEAKKDKEKKEKLYANLSKYEAAKMRRRNIQLDANVEVVIYKSLE